LRIVKNCLLLKPATQCAA